MNKDFLKDLIFVSLERALEDYRDKADSYFFFAYTQDKNEIKFEATVKVLHGNISYDVDDDYYNPDLGDKTSMYFFDNSKIHEVITHFRSKEHEVPENDLCQYFESKKEFHMPESMEKKEEDVFCNTPQVRSIHIPIEDMAQYLLDNPYTIPIELFKNRIDIDWNEKPQLQSTLMAYLLDSSLDQSLKKVRQIKI